MIDCFKSFLPFNFNFKGAIIRSIYRLNSGYYEVRFMLIPFPFLYFKINFKFMHSLKYLDFHYFKNM